METETEQSNGSAARAVIETQRATFPASWGFGFSYFSRGVSDSIRIKTCREKVETVPKPMEILYVLYAQNGNEFICGLQGLIWST